jgi:hypothetical protein
MIIATITFGPCERRGCPPGRGPGPGAVRLTHPTGCIITSAQADVRPKAILDSESERYGFEQINSINPYAYFIQKKLNSIILPLTFVSYFCLVQQLDFFAGPT